MKKIIWKLLEMIDNNHGYSTPLQKRFKIGENVRISFAKLNDTSFTTGEIVTIIQTGRHDYLVKNLQGVKQCVYQFELMK
jgi:hypothetical protein